jgi:hypothetical protein
MEPPCRRLPGSTRAGAIQHYCKENMMSTIVVKDLTESVELDRKAMTAITGGSRTRGRMPFPGPAASQGNRLIDYPPGVKRNRLGVLHTQLK